MRTTLKALVWDDPRATRPMEAAAARYAQLETVDVEISVRPLTAFNDQPLEEVVETFDIISLDHPMMGRAVERNLLFPLDTREEDDVQSDSLDRSLMSYRLGGRQWAMPTDAACHVSAWREDLLSDLKVDVPERWDLVPDFCEEFAGRVLWPLYPTDAICSLLTIMASNGHAVTDDDPRMSTELASEAFALMARCVKALHPNSLGVNPSAALQVAGQADTVIYIPLTFGYASYARQRSGMHPLTFGLTPAGLAGSRPILGGAGLAVSAQSSRVADAAQFVRWSSSLEVELSVIAASGGQPGSSQAWRRLAKIDTAGFFATTMSAMTQSFVRPRHPWWPRYQERAGYLIHQHLKAVTSPGQVGQDLASLLDSARSQKSDSLQLQD